MLRCCTCCRARQLEFRQISITDEPRQRTQWCGDLQIAIALGGVDLAVGFFNLADVFKCPHMEFIAQCRSAVPAVLPR